MMGAIMDLLWLVMIIWVVGSLILLFIARATDSLWNHVDIYDVVFFGYVFVPIAWPLIIIALIVVVIIKIVLYAGWRVAVVIEKYEIRKKSD